MHYFETFLTPTTLSFVRLPFLLIVVPLCLMIVSIVSTLLLLRSQPKADNAISSDPSRYGKSGMEWNGKWLENPDKKSNHLVCTSFHRQIPT